MLRQRWVRYLMLGGGCALAGIVAGAAIVTRMRLPAASIDDAQTARNALSTRAAPEIPADKPVTVTPAPLSTPGAVAIVAPQAGASAAAVATTPGAANQPAGDRPTSTGTDSPQSVPATATRTPEQSTATHTPTPSRTPTLTRTPTPSRTPTLTHTPTPPRPTRTPTPAPPTPAPSSAPLPSATSAPVESTGSVHVLSVSYASSTDLTVEHLSLVNCDSKLIDVTNWKIKSIATGDIYTLPAYVARPGCGAQVRFTINTHRIGNESNQQGIFTWDQPASRAEWPNQPGRVELYDAAGALEAACSYQPDPAQSQVACH